MFNAFHRSSALLALVPFAALSQATPDPKPAADPIRKIESLTVTASPLDRTESEMAQPATVLSEEELRRKRAASIGDTLGSELGVHSSAFGAGSGRPIIRGLEGARVRVLENGIGTMDASSVSPDHMVTTESLKARQIEVLRGPASLLYGSGAIGGVVNVVSDLVPEALPERPKGNVEARYSSGDRGRTGAFNLDGPMGEIAWHLDAFARRTRDYRIPGRAVRGEPDSPTGRLPNSDVDSRGLGVGASWIGPRGYLGAGIETLANDYGIPTGEGVRIDLERTRGEIAGEWHDPLQGVQRLKMRIAANDYEHREIEPSGEVGTTFTNRAGESRFELAHAAWAGIKGTIGMQFQSGRIAAIGEEAIIPRTRTSAASAFIVEEKKWDAWTVDAGVRFERESRRPEGDLPHRRFSLVSPALGIVRQLGGGHALSLNVTQAQRAPATEELYSLGAHHATATFDIGNPGLRKEISRNIDLGIGKSTGTSRWKLNLFHNRIRDYVFAASEDIDGDGEADRVDEEGTLDPDGEFLVQRFTQARATFRGVEVEWSLRSQDGRLGTRIFGDVVRARLRDGANLPRIAPARVGAEADSRFGPWSLSLSAIHAFAQKRTAPLETPTPGYTRVDGEVTWTLASGRGRTIFFLQARNLLDREIRLHTSHLKELAPQMGRSFTAGVRGEF